MNKLSDCLTHGTKIVTGVTGICPVDGKFSITDYQPPYVAIQFHQTGNNEVFLEDEIIFDSRKRKWVEDPAYWYSVAVGLEGYTYPNGKRIVDVLSATNVILNTGERVRIEYQGKLPKIRSRAAYGKWALIMGQDEDNVFQPWHDFQIFQEWYIATRPTTKRKWSLRSVNGTWSPATCGFDDRTDLPVSSAVLIDSVFTR